MTITLQFIYGNNIYKKKCNKKNELIHDILIKYASMINQNIKDLYFIYNGNKLSSKNKVKILDFIKNEDSNYIIINVINLKKEKKVKILRI